MNREELTKHVKKTFWIQSKNCLHTRNILNNDILINELLIATNYLPENTNIKERWYHIEHELYEKQTCLICNDIVSFEDGNQGYKTFCSSACAVQYKKLFIVEKVNLLPKNIPILDYIKLQQELEIYLKCDSGRKLNTGKLLILGSNLATKQILKSIWHYTSFLNQEDEIGQRCYCVLNNIKENPICKSESCNNLIKYSNSTYYNDYCSTKCASIDTIDKREKTSLEKYGVKNIFENKEYIQKKTKEKYGVTNVSKLPEVEEKKRETYEKNREETVKNKLNNNFHKVMARIIEQYNVKPLFTVKEYEGVQNNYKWECIDCGHIFLSNLKDGSFPVCRKCYPYNKSYSSIETELYNWLSAKILTENNKRFYYDKLHFYELDLYVPEFKLGIEINGNYWHSELNLEDKNKHLKKTEYFKEQGIQVLHIFDDEFIEKKDIVKSMILSKINRYQQTIFARKCEIKIVLAKDSKIFLNNNHLQGYFPVLINLGLYYKDELVSLITFDNSRYVKNYEYELIRFCNKLHTKVIGGFSKLLTHFIRNYSDSIISYADRRYSNGNLYYKNNFELKSISRPTYYYLSPKEGYAIRHHRRQFQKKLLPEKLENFDPNLTEWENMQNNKYTRIWNCGNLVFTYNNVTN